MRDAGWGPALPDPAGARGTPHNWGTGLSGVSRALPVGGPCATADRTGVREGVLRFKGDRRALLLVPSPSAFGRCLGSCRRAVFASATFQPLTLPALRVYP